MTFLYICLKKGTIGKLTLTKRKHCLEALYVIIIYYTKNNCKNNEDTTNVLLSCLIISLVKLLQ